MPTKTETISLREFYEQAAQDYLHSLPLEHFMESTPQATQRKITVESLDLVTARRPEVQVFNELLVQYPIPGRIRPGQVVPDNMVVLHDETIDAVGSYDIAAQPAGPFWMLEYVSKSNRRKDYVDNMERYEQDLGVPYYLLFDPDNEAMTLYRHDGKRYEAVRANQAGRYEVKELAIEVALLEGWVRFWQEGELLPLPADLLKALESTKLELHETKDALQESRQAHLATKDALQESQQTLSETKDALQDSQRKSAELAARAEAAERELAQLRVRAANGKN